MNEQHELKLDKKQNKIEAIAEHMNAVLRYLGVESTPSTEETGLRIAKMYVNEVFKNINDENLEELNAKIKLFPNEQQGMSELIIFKKIHFHSMCEHHFMPFEGDMYIAYLPKEKIVGLSKVPRVVEYFSKRPQLQERLVNDVANYLYEKLDPALLFVLATDVVHTCVTARGVETYCEVETMATRVDYDIIDSDELFTILKNQFYARISK